MYGNWITATKAYSLIKGTKVSCVSPLRVFFFFSLLLGEKKYNFLMTAGASRTSTEWPVGLSGPRPARSPPPLSSEYPPPLSVFTASYLLYSSYFQLIKLNQSLLRTTHHFFRPCFHVLVFQNMRPAPNPLPPAQPPASGYF